jgi:hypothetical protein
LAISLSYITPYAPLEFPESELAHGSGEHAPTRAPCPHSPPGPPRARNSRPASTTASTAPRAPGRGSRRVAPAHSTAVDRPPPDTDQKVANRNGRGFRVGARSCGRFAPADLPRHDCSSYSHVIVRRESVGVIPRSRTIFCRAVPNLNVTIRDFCIAVLRAFRRRRTMAI